VLSANFGHFDGENAFPNAAIQLGIRIVALDNSTKDRGAIASERIR
jgi:hypothetical protein